MKFQNTGNGIGSCEFPERKKKYRFPKEKLRARMNLDVFNSGTEVQIQ